MNNEQLTIDNYRRDASITPLKINYNVIDTSFFLKLKI